MGDLVIETKRTLNRAKIDFRIKTVTTTKLKV